MHSQSLTLGGAALGAVTPSLCPAAFELNPNALISRLEDRLGNAVTPALRVELRSLAAESDPTLLYEGLLHLGVRQEQGNQVEIAGTLYSAVVEAGSVAGSALTARAQRQLDAILGRGAFGARAEFLLRNLAQQASDPVTLAAMGTAGAVFRMTRLATLGRLAASPTSNFLTRGLGARAVAGLAGFALEAPAFTLGGRLAGTALGREVDWGRTALVRDIASSYLVLGGLKLAGAAGAGLYGRFGGANPLARGLYTQGSMLAGILGGHWLEVQAGLRPATPGATTLVDSLATLIQFHVAGQLGRQAFGPRVAAWERTLELQTELLARDNFRARGAGWGGGLRPALSASGVEPGTAGERGRDELLHGLQVLMSRMDDPKGGRGPEGHPLPLGGGSDPMEPKYLDRQISTLLFDAGGNLELGLRNFIEGLPMATAVARLERGNKDFGRIFMVNRAFRDLFAYTEREIGEVPLMQFFNPLKSAFIFARIWNIFRAGIFNPSDMELRHRDGHWVKIRGSGVVKDLGEHSIAFGFLEPRETAGREAVAQRQLLEAFQVSKQDRDFRASADGLIEVGSILELSGQLTRNDGALLREIVDRDVRIRITNMPWARVTEELTDPLVRFLNVQTRKFDFPTTRRVVVEFPATPDRPRFVLTLVKWAEGFRTSGSPAEAADASATAHDPVPSPLRAAPSIAAPPLSLNPQAAPTPSLDATTASVLATLHGELNNAVTGARDRLAKEDVEVPVQGTYSTAFLNANREAIQTELQAITERRIPVVLGRQVTLVFTTDRGELRWAFRKVLRRFEPVDD